MYAHFSATVLDALDSLSGTPTLYSGKGFVKYMRQSELHLQVSMGAECHDKS